MTEPLPLASRGGTRLEALTGVRAFAAMWVVLLHFAVPLYGLLPGLRFARRFTQQGFLGVDLFFVLSGFILSYNYFDRFAGGVSVKEWRRFLRLRLARIWPAHVFTLHVLVAMYLVARYLGVTLQNAETSQYTVSGYLHNVLLTHAWFLHDLTWNGPSWTISAEWAAYLVFPALTLLVARATTLRRAWLGVAVSYLVWLVVVRLWLWGDTMSIDGALARVGTQFLAGCFLFIVYRMAPPRRRSFLAAAATVLLLATIPWPWQHTRSYVVSPLFGLAILGLARGDVLLGPILEHRAARYLGEVSYSLYLIHILVLAGLGKLLPWSGSAHAALGQRLVVIAAYCAAIVAATIFTYRYVEQPSRARIARGAAGRSSPRMKPDDGGRRLGADPRESYRGRLVSDHGGVDDPAPRSAAEWAAGRRR